MHIPRCFYDRLQFRPLKTNVLRPGRASHCQPSFPRLPIHRLYTTPQWTHIDWSRATQGAKKQLIHLLVWLLLVSTFYRFRPAEDFRTLGLYYGVFRSPRSVLLPGPTPVSGKVSNLPTRFFQSLQEQRRHDFCHKTTSSISVRLLSRVNFVNCYLHFRVPIFNQAMTITSVCMYTNFKTSLC